ncbi:hypothetical protein F5146DRAFT_372521 [Armillaria mellea]|nr:hypothetical protein F5146DRAFT_372521 [Armillaria mellea]
MSIETILMVLPVTVSLYIILLPPGLSIPSVDAIGIHRHQWRLLGPVASIASFTSLWRTVDHVRCHCTSRACQPCILYSFMWSVGWRVLPFSRRKFHV